MARRDERPPSSPSPGKPGAMCDDQVRRSGVGHARNGALAGWRQEVDAGKQRMQKGHDGL